MKTIGHKLKKIAQLLVMLERQRKETDRLMSLLVKTLDEFYHLIKDKIDG